MVTINRLVLFEFFERKYNAAGNSGLEDHNLQKFKQWIPHNLHVHPNIVLQLANVNHIQHVCQLEKNRSRNTSFLSKNPRGYLLIECRRN